MHRFFVVVAIVVMPFSASAADVDYVRDVRPILQNNCYSCHGTTKQKSGLRLDIKSEAFRGGDGWGPSIIAGKASESSLIELVSSSDRETRMPPEGYRLSESEIQTLRGWINSGAVWPDGVDLAQLPEKLDHWSFKPLTPSSKDLSIDHFIAARLATHSLQRNAPADPRTLVRRLYLDLTGLPPSPDDVIAFVQQPDVERLVDQLLDSPQYGQRWAQHWLDVIRWAETVGFETNAERENAWHYRDWVIESLNDDKPYDRFLFEQLAGDTVGEDAALGFLVAGPANLPGQIGRDEAAMRNARQDELDEVISTVSQAFLGLTVACARCHDHKFDPITQRDYYSMQAIFSGLTYGTRRLRGPQNDAWIHQIPAAKEKVETLLASLESTRIKHQLRQPLADVHTESFERVSASAVRMRIDATTNGSAASLYEFEVWTKAVNHADSTNVALASRGATVSASSFALANQSRHFDNLTDGAVDLRQSYPWVAAKGGSAWFRVDFHEPKSIDRVILHRGSNMPAIWGIDVLIPGTGEWIEVANAHDRLPRIDDTRKAEVVELAALSRDETKQILDLLAKIRAAKSELARLSAGPQVYAAKFTSTPAPTHLLHRGDAMQRGEEVAPAIPEFLGELYVPQSGNESECRVAFARHLTQPHHPLTARVIVNRIWQHHFGAGLVDTPSDLGKMGTAPSHPELLDWLALRFISDGWSLKKLHRLIVNSESYRQSSHPRDEALSVDAGARLLWRYPPRRLEAEAIRDSILCVSGKLNLKAGGAGFNLFNQRGGLSDYKPKESFENNGWRRMIYSHRVRMISVDIFGAFDCPDFGQMRPSRSRSVTPVQALALLNSPFVSRQADFFAKRIRDEIGNVPAQQVERAFDIAYSRKPTASELSRLIDLANDHGLAQVCRAILNTSEFVFIR